MSTTASPKIYLAAAIQRGAADAWINFTKPAIGTPSIVLDLPTGTPDATTSPNALHLGLMESASMMVYTPKPDLEKADQDTGIIAVFDNEEDCVIELTLRQTQFNAVMQHCMPGTAFSDATKEGITLGRGANIVRTPVTLALISKAANPAYAWVVAQLYGAVPVGPITFELDKAKSTIYKVKFQGVSDLTRPSGDRIGNVYQTN